MPRELIHWEIAYRAARTLTAANPSGLGGIALHHRAPLALGAVAHDAPYYFRGGAAPFEAVGTLLHGRGGGDPADDPLGPLDRFALLGTNQSDNAARDTTLAFLVGLISHYATDVIFHPYIFYATGDYYATDPAERHRARALHRLIEVYLDEHIRDRGTHFPWSNSLRTLIASLPPTTLETICRLLGEATAPYLGTPAHLPALWRRSFDHMAIFQTAFLSPACGAIVAALNRLLNGRLYQYDCLFSYRRTGPFTPLDGPIEFRNPVTGAPTCTTFDALLSAAEFETVRIVQTVERALKTGSYSPGTLRDGLSLNYGLRGTPPNGATTFSPTPLIDKRTQASS